MSEWVSQVQEVMRATMKAAGLSRFDVARRMGVQRSFVTRLLTDGTNITFRTLNQFFAACDHRLVISAEPERRQTPAPPEDLGVLPNDRRQSP